MIPPAAPGRATDRTTFDHVVLGGGLAGLSIALNLVRRFPNDHVLLLEKESTLGGLARSDLLDDVLFDFGPHVLRDRDGRALERLSPEVRLREYRTRPATYKHATYFDHVIPVVSRANIERLPGKVRASVERETARIRAEGEREDLSSFGGYLDARLGPTLSWEFFGEYSQKWWGLEPHRISIQLAPKGVRIGDAPSYSTVATGFVHPTRELYPEKGGYGAIVSALSSRAERVGPEHLEVRTGSRVRGLARRNGRVEEVEVDGSPSVRVEKRVFSTLPLSTLGRFLDVETPLRYRSNIAVNVTAPRNASKEVPASWVYFPEPEVSFARLCAPGNFSPGNEPGDRRGFCAEIPCQEGDAAWRAEDATWRARVISDLGRLGFLEGNDEVHARVRREPTAYPILDLSAGQVREATLARLAERASNVLPVGRTGAFNYWNADSVLALSDLSL